MPISWPMLYSFISCCCPTLFVASEEQTINWTNWYRSVVENNEYLTKSWILQQISWGIGQPDIIVLNLALGRFWFKLCRSPFDLAILNVIVYLIKYQKIVHLDQLEKHEKIGEEKMDDVDKAE